MTSAAFQWPICCGGACRPRGPGSSLAREARRIASELSGLAGLPLQEDVGKRLPSSASGVPVVSTMPRPAKSARPIIVFVSGAPGTAQHVLHIDNPAEALAPRYFETHRLAAAELADNRDLVLRASLLWLWGVSGTGRIAEVLREAQAAGIRIVCDPGAAAIEPATATEEIREIAFDLRTTLRFADHCVAQTAAGGTQLARHGKPVTVIPYCFPRAFESECRVARHGDGPVRTPGAPVRLGFAALFYGSRIDLKSTVDDLAPVLRERIEVRLVLPAARPDISTYPALQAIGDRIEWRDGVLPDQLAAEIARWDVNLAPFAKDDAEGRAIAELGRLARRSSMFRQ